MYSSAKPYWQGQGLRRSTQACLHFNPTFRRCVRAFSSSLLQSLHCKTGIRHLLICQTTLTRPRLDFGSIWHLMCIYTLTARACDRKYFSADSASGFDSWVVIERLVIVNKKCARLQETIYWQGQPLIWRHFRTPKVFSKYSGPLFREHDYLAVSNTSVHKI